MKRKGLMIVLSLTLVFSILFVSAGWLNKITGHATNQPTNVSVGVTGVQPVTVGPVDNTTLTGGVTPTELGTSNVLVYVQICDPDGVSDLNDSATDVEFINGSTTREGSCSHVGDIDSNCANYSCNGDLYYWDTPGTWIINISGSDLGNQSTIFNDTYTFKYNQLKAMVISPDSLTWATLSSGSTNEKANNDPTIVNNTGNYNGTVDINAIDLLGEITPSQKIPADNFTADPADGSVCGSGTVLNNGTDITITGTYANRGNLSAGGGAGQEEIYYCIPNVPLVSSQQYSTSQGGSWTIKY